MALQVSGQNTSTQGSAPVRQSYDTSLTTMDAHAKYQQAVLGGFCFASANQTGVTTQAGLSATTPVLTLANPKGSNKLVVLWYAGFIMTVTTNGAGAVWLAANTNVSAAAVTGTVATFSNCQVGNTNNPSAQIFTAATLPAAPIGICILGAALTGAATTQVYNLSASRWFDGSIQVLPGGALSIQTAAASAASSTWADFIWEEIPLTAINS